MNFAGRRLVGQTDGWTDRRTDGQIDYHIESLVGPSVTQLKFEPKSYLFLVITLVNPQTTDAVAFTVLPLLLTLDRIMIL